MRVSATQSSLMMFSRKGYDRLVRTPFGEQQVDQFRLSQGQVGDEVLMGSLGSIGGLVGGVGEQGRDPREIELIQQGSVKQDSIAGPALGIPREFAFAVRIGQSEVGVAANHHLVLQAGTKALRLAVHDPLVGTSYAR